MSKDFKDIVQEKLPVIKESLESAVNFVKNALLTGWTDADIRRGLFLNGFKEEIIHDYLKKGHNKLEDVSGE